MHYSTTRAVIDGIGVERVMHKVKVEELTKEAFAPYGIVVEMPEGAKKESAVEDLWPGLVKWELDHETLEIAHGVCKKRPLVVEGLERHNTTYELLVPIKSDLIVPVASEDDRENKDAQPLARNVRGFLVKVGQAVFYDKGVWHLSPYPVEDEGPFFVVFKHKTAPDNIIMKELDEEVELEY